MVLNRRVVDLSDSLDFFFRADRLFTPEGAWVNGFYPFGYPLLLNIGTHITGDYLVTAKLISWVSALVALCFFYAVAKRLLGHKAISILLTFSLAFNVAFFKVAILDGTDMASFCLTLISFYYFSYISEKQWGPILLAGIFLGLSYLIRYTALVILLGMVLSLLLYYKAGFKVRSRQVVALLIGFLVAASPQLILSFLGTGQLFYSRQFVNVWFGIYGQGDFGKYMGLANEQTSLWHVFAADPDKFLLNMRDNSVKLFFAQMFDYPFQIFTYAGILVLAIAGYWRKKAGWLLLLSVGFGAAISMAFVYYRIGLPVLPGIILISGLGLVAGYRYLSAPSRPLWLSAQVVSVVAVLFTFIWVCITLQRFYEKNGARITEPMPPEDQARFSAQAALKANGYTDPKQVLAFSFNQYDVYKPTHDVFSRPWYTDGNTYANRAELETLVRKSHALFLLTDTTSSWVIPGVKAFWPAAGFEKYADKIFSQAGVVVWRVRPNTFSNDVNLPAKEIKN